MWVWADRTILFSQNSPNFIYHIISTVHIKNGLSTFPSHRYSLQNLFNPPYTWYKPLGCTNYKFTLQYIRKNCPKNVPKTEVCWAWLSWFYNFFSTFIRQNKSLWKLANLKKGSTGISRFLSAIPTKVISSVMAKVEMANNIH